MLLSTVWLFHPRAIFASRRCEESGRSGGKRHSFVSFQSLQPIILDEVSLFASCLSREANQTHDWLPMRVKQTRLRLVSRTWEPDTKSSYAEKRNNRIKRFVLFFYPCCCWEWWWNPCSAFCNSFTKQPTWPRPNSAGLASTEMIFCLFDRAG